MPPPVVTLFISCSSLPCSGNRIGFWFWHRWVHRYFSYFWYFLRYMSVFEIESRRRSASHLAATGCRPLRLTVGQGQSSGRTTMPDRDCPCRRTLRPSETPPLLRQTNRDDATLVTRAADRTSAVLACQTLK